ncbi:MAG: phage tail protein [Gammaproteobacteria bacterium]
MQFFIGQITQVGFGFAPRDTADCDGQLLPIVQHQALFSLLGSTFGGDARTTFALPDLRGRVPAGVNPSIGFTQGTRVGQEEVTLTTDQMAAHSHGIRVSTEDADTFLQGGSEVLAKSSAPAYGSPSNLVPLNVNVVSEAYGPGGTHDNMQPSLVVRFIIALDGIYPSRN